MKVALAPPDKIKPCILLEVGFDQTTPNERIDITSWAYEKAKNSNVAFTDNISKQDKCYYPEYTLVEKMQTISTKVRKQQETGIFQVNFLRHFYDIHMLFKQDRVKKFINTEEYFQHKLNRFRKQDELLLTENLAFNLDKDSTLFMEYSNEFDKLKDLFISEMPSFDEVYESIAELRRIG